MGSLVNFAFRASLVLGFLCLWSCNKNYLSKSHDPEVNVWATRGDQSSLLKKQTSSLTFSTPTIHDLPRIEVSTDTLFQSVEGFGYTLTGGSAMLIQKMQKDKKNLLLEHMFGCSDDKACVSYLRVSMGASDLDEKVFSYNDLPHGEMDIDLTYFNLSYDTLYLIPLLKKILKINPNLQLMSTPWSPPVWMKSNQNSIGGTLMPQYYDLYADYFVKYIRAMKVAGIPIHAVTVQNEPHHGGNNPSMLMSAKEESEFIKLHLGPKFRDNGIATKIIIWDHNCDKPEYPISILSDSISNSYIAGSAFHLYAGDVSAMSEVHRAFPDKHLYLTEQWTGAKGTFDGDLMWHIKNVIIGSMRNWSRVALEWNLANDLEFKPHTSGGCDQCKGALTIDGDAVTKNVSYYIISQISRFVPPGSVRVYSSLPDDLPNVAFLTPSGKKILLVLNETERSISFSIRCKKMEILPTLTPKTVATFVW